MKIKIATWNMSYWQHKKYLEESWDYFLNEINADIFFFQEAKRPKRIENDKNFLWHNTGESNGRKEWGSGIYCTRYKLSEEPEESILDWNRDRFKEFCVIANAKITEDISLTLISLYGRMDKIGNKRVKDASSNLHKIFSDLTGILNRHYGKRNIILGGDFNISIQFDKKWGGDSGKILLNRLKDYNLENCYELNGNEDFVQTLRFPKSGTKWQNDYFFISKSISRKFTNCEVVDNNLVRKYSDHNPVVITLDL